MWAPTLIKQLFHLWDQDSSLLTDGWSHQSWGFPPGPLSVHSVETLPLCMAQLNIHWAREYWASRCSLAVVAVPGRDSHLCSDECWSIFYEVFTGTKTRQHSVQRTARRGPARGSSAAMGRTLHPVSGVQVKSTCIQQGKCFLVSRGTYLLLAAGAMCSWEAFLNYQTEAGKSSTLGCQEKPGLRLPTQLNLALYMYFEFVFF